MKRKLLPALLIALSLFTSSRSSAVEEKPVDAFIRHVSETHQFTPVSNIWQPDNSFDKTEMLKMVAKAQPLVIDYTQVAGFMQDKKTAIDLVLPGTGGKTFTIHLARYDYFSDEFEVHEKGLLGDKKVSYTPGLYYSGIVAGIPGSVAAFSFFNNEVYGIFSIPGEGNYVVAPNTMVGESYNYNQHYILYNDADILFKDKAPVCAADAIPQINTAHKTTTTANNNVFNNCTQVRCYEVADYAMYVKKGSTVANSTNYITAMFNNKATIYKNEGIPLELKYVQINSATDDYQTLPTTSSSRWLNKFGWVTQNAMHGCDVATLFTTKGGSMGGVAWLGTMCEGYYPADSAGPYAFCNINNSSTLTVTAFPTFSWDIEVSTHEMGHVLGSPHTHRCCWGPTRTTAIDGCYTIEGTCADPGDPSPTVGGTIMSYCHLTSSGINFSNGFGQQPGDTVRYFLAHTFSSTCGSKYFPGVAIYKANRVISANRECTDLTSGTTYYWKDNGTAIHSDDTLVLMIKKNGNTIGNLNTAGFSVKSGTLTAWGAGTGQPTTFPLGTAGVGASNYSMNRYWRVNATTRAASSVEVIYPFTIKDSADIDGGIPGAAIPITSLKMYKADSAIDPTPATSFTGATSASFKTYSYGTTASTTQWSLTRSGDTCFAHMLVSNLSGGGTGFYPVGAVSGVANVQGADANVNIYPNPASDKWFVAINGSNEPEMNIEIYAADGKLVHSQALQTGTLNTISAAQLPVGMYYYRVISTNSIYTGSLMKR